MADTAALVGSITRWAVEVEHRASDLMLQALKDAAPVGATGDTVRGITKQDAELSTTFVSSSPHGDFVEHGTPAHVILPRNAKVLVFPGTSGAVSVASPNQRVPTRGGGMVFARHVNHPGTHARPWFEPTLQTWPILLQRAALTTPL